jgi:hypothetical protein
MTTHKDTAGIIERLEAASGPDDALDHDIGMLVGFGGSFSASIDAALSLVPEGWNWTIRGADVLGASKPYALLGLPGLAETEAHGATPAIALVSAALRARAHKGSDDASASSKPNRTQQYDNGERADTLAIALSAAPQIQTT